MDPQIEKRHIESNPDTCGGAPCVSGTRIRVWDIHVWHDLRGLSPEEIVANFPSLSLAAVHAALAHYLDHREQIDAEMASARIAVAAFEAEQGATRFSLLRDELFKMRDGESAISSR